MFVKRYDIAVIVILIFIAILYTQQKSFGYETNVRITDISIDRQTISIYSVGKPTFKQSNFERNYEKFFILSFERSILTGKARVIYTPFPAILKLIITQFSIKPDTVHIVMREAFFNPFSIKTFHIRNNRYVTIIYPILIHKFKVFLDVGHGGSDPGGIGPLGLPESFVNLSVALKLKQLLKDRGIDVELSRISNTFVSLPRRVSEADKSGANIFIGLYCNASKDHRLYGTTTYYYHKSGYKFAKYLENYISNKLGLKNDGVVKDSLYVIRYVTKMPAVLIEYGYISNKHEEQLLASFTFRHLVALTIANAVYNYYILHKTGFN